MACSVFAEDIGYIAKNASKPEGKIIAAIEDLGYSYKLIDDSEIPSTDFSKYEMILVWDELLANYDKIPITKKKAIVGNSYYLNTWKIADYTGSKISSGYLSAQVYDENSRITEGIADNLQVYNTKEISLNYLLYKPKRAPGIVPLVVTDNYNEYPIVGIINPGGGLYGGGTCEQRTVFFGISGANYWTSESENLFKNSIEWTLYGDDSDQDGYFYDEDCNDKNPNINPSEQEIPYNGLDDDCEGYDLLDVDNDGYCKLWQNIVNKTVQCPKESGSKGTDCDDSDETTNLNSTDIYKNCKNDAPIAEPIQKITIEEGEEAIIEIQAEDPEEDILSYSINDSRFEQDENLFAWQTGFYDAGIYYFKITVSDGNLTITENVEIEVKNTNQAPTCDKISYLEWQEDGTYELKLGDYCYDLDGDVLSYGVYATSAEDNIAIDSFENDTVNFSSKKDWHGQDWISFIADDGLATGDTGIIALNVTSVNDAPVLSKEISNITWKEDTNLTDYLSLENYFTDVDSKLNYSVTGNSNITIIINKGKASFIPLHDWYGNETVVFSVYDGESSISSNSVNLEVYDVNEPPEIVNFSCNNNTLEDTEYNCSIEAEDFEGNTYWFTSSNEDDLDCYFNGSVLYYISYPDYNGQASCTIRANDEYGYSEYVFETSIENVNDAPRIKPNPSADFIRIIEGRTQLFESGTFDADGDTLSLLWELDGEEVGNSQTYLFSKPVGTYTIEVIANDSKLADNYTWTAKVGSISEFTCSEVGGYTCKENEMCYLNEILGVKDIDNCCAVQCTPKFEEIERCQNISDSISIEIKEPDDGEDFSIGETITVTAKIKNNLKEDTSIDAEAYFYDLTEDEIVEDDSDSFSLDKGDSEEVEFEFDIGKDLEENDYAVFVKALDEDDYCNEKFVKINVKREKEDVAIKEITADENLQCGNDFELSVKVANLGSRDQDVIIKAENKELGISAKSEEFELKKYGSNKDEATKTLMLHIPESAKGVYNLSTTVSYSSKERKSQNEISIECKEAEQSQEEIKIISLNKKEEATQENKNNILTESSKRGVLLTTTLVTTILVLVVIIYLVYLLFHNNKKVK
jgi:hypothetical protein